MAPEEIVVSALPGDRRAAWLAAGRLLRFFHQGPPEALACGDIVLGRVGKRAPALGATFVDIGDDREAGGRAGVLMAADAPGLAGGQRRLAEGDAVLVQIRRAATAGKGAKLTRRIGMHGRYVTLQPAGNGIALARSLAATAEGERVLERAGAVLARAHGWVLRGGARCATAAALAAEAAALIEAWQAILAAAATARPPTRLFAAADAVVAAVRDGLNPALSHIVVDDAVALAELRRELPAAAPLLRLHPTGQPLLVAAGVDEQLEAALTPVIALACGGRITIAETEALVAIDVDAGATRGGDARATALAVNTEAAAAIAEAIVLRELAGIIVIDFVAMRHRGQRARVLEVLRAGLACDDRQTDIAGFTALGLVEIRRAREGPSLRERLSARCPGCRGSGRAPAPLLAAGDGLRALVAATHATPHRSHRLVAAQDVIDALSGPMAPAVRACAQRLGRPPSIARDPALPPGGYRVEPDTDKG